MILTPSNLEVVEDTSVNWNSVNTANMQRINTKLGSLMSGTEVVGEPVVDVVEAADTDQQELAAANGTANTTIPDAGATYSQSTINNIVKSLVVELNHARDDIELLRAKNEELIQTLIDVGLLGE